MAKQGVLFTNTFTPNAKCGKSLSEVDKVFGFWPDNDTVRNDLLDYAFEMEGKSLVLLFKETQKADFREFMVIGKERTDLGRPDDQGYPIRGIVNKEFIYLRNYNPERWPAGNPETGYMDCDGSPTKSFILNDRRTKGKSKFWDLNFGKLPPEELYKVSVDPEFLDNLAEKPEYKNIKIGLIRKLTRKLKKDKDPRFLGHGDIFDTFPYSEDTRNFYNRFMSGEKLKAGWINPTDIEKVKIGE